MKMGGKRGRRKGRPGKKSVKSSTKKSRANERRNQNLPGGGGNSTATEGHRKQGEKGFVRSRQVTARPGRNGSRSAQSDEG